MAEQEEIRELLSELNHWEQNYGTAHKNDPQLKDRGEANARIDDLKKSLKEKGALFYWNGTEYVLDSIIGLGQGEEIPVQDENGSVSPD
jgi:hypothetical protein